jgi:hypothetical protein
MQNNSIFLISVNKTARSRSTDLEHLVIRSKRDSNKLSKIRSAD